MSHERSSTEDEIARGERFAFGENWRAFLSTMSEERISVAVATVQDLLARPRLDGLTFLDVGSGSGLFSLAAHRLGARVFSFDADLQSVRCTEELRARFADENADWTIARGSILDDAFVDALPRFDVVYAWGVLHHTGEMWRAIDRAASLVDDSGLFALAIYNDQGLRSRAWRHVKQMYCSGAIGRAAMSSVFVPYFFARAVARSAIDRENAFAKYVKNRGMSLVHDWRDWLGGYPYEVASVDALVEHVRARGFTPVKVRAVGDRWGCNEFAFARRRA